MSSYKKKPNLFETQEGVEIVLALKKMDADNLYKTGPSYSANTTLYPNNLIPFVNKHMDYLRSHPATDPRHYVANLRLMTRVK
jgi:hypothetical protein